MFVCYTQYVCMIGIQVYGILGLTSPTGLECGLWGLGFSYQSLDFSLMTLVISFMLLDFGFMAYVLCFYGLCSMFYVICLVTYVLCTKYWVFGFRVYVQGFRDSSTRRGVKGGLPLVRIVKADRLTRFLGRSPKPPEVL